MKLALNCENVTIDNETFNSIVISNSKKNPLKTAYIELNSFGDQVALITYQQLINNVTKISEKLEKRYEKGDRCIIAMSSGINFISAFLGCLFSGIIAVPCIYPKRKKANSRFWSIISNSEANGIITESNSTKLLSEVLASSGASRNPEILDFNLLLKGEAKETCKSDISESDIAFLQYTSGSVGNPKGIKVTQKNLLNNSEVIRQSFNHTKDLVTVSWLPPFHDMGLIGSMLQPLYVGGTCVILQPSDFIKKPDLWFKAISKYKGTTAGCPNFALDYCVEKIVDVDINTMDLSSLKVLFCGSENVRKNSLENFATKFSKLNFTPEMFLPCYGMAEATLMISGIGQAELPNYYTMNNHETKSKALIYTSCGRPWNNTEIIIVDPETRLELNEQEIGEIWVKSDSVCDGYWHSESDLSFNSYTSDSINGPFLRTGDLGFLHQKELFITGRLKELIIIRGRNFFPADIENMVDNCDFALQPNGCAAFTIDDNKEEKLVIVQELKRTFIDNIDYDEIYRSILALVSDRFDITVSSIILTTPLAIPRTTSGKIQRLKCKEMYSENELKVISSWELVHDPYLNNDICGDDIKQWMINWIAAKLNLDKDQIDPEESIMSQGLDSIGAVELETAINDKFGLDFFIGDFIENNSINYLSVMAHETKVN